MVRVAGGQSILGRACSRLIAGADLAGSPNKPRHPPQLAPVPENPHGSVRKEPFVGQRTRSGSGQPLWDSNAEKPRKRVETIWVPPRLIVLIAANSAGPPPGHQLASDGRGPAKSQDRILTEGHQRMFSHVMVGTNDLA